MTETNRTLAAVFESMADFLEARRENPHRIRAYRRAAQSVRHLNDDLAAVARRGELNDIPGIGKELAAKIDEFLQTGSIQAYRELKKPLPPQIAEWTSLPGLTDAAVQHLYFRLGIATLEDLDTLVRSHLLRTVPGLNVREEELLESITSLKDKVKAEAKGQGTPLRPNPQP